MAEIKVNEYVRTTNGKIAKYIGYNKELELHMFDKGIKWHYEYYTDIFEEDEFNEFINKDIVKHSKQLIDLIEIGDYVNGYRILAIEDSIYKNSKRILIYKNQKEKYERWIYIQEYDGKIHTQDDLVEILTKEQFDANCYKVGGEDE